MLSFGSSFGDDATVDFVPTVRGLTLADCDIAAAVIRLAFSNQSVNTDPPPGAVLETAESVSEYLANTGGGAAAVVGDDVVGLVLWEERDGGLYFGRLAVHPDFRSQGVARLLVDAVESEARIRGLQHLYAAVRLVLVDNRRLFASLGFLETETSAHPGYAEPTMVAIERRVR